MRQLTLNQTIVSVVVAALLPVIIFGLIQTIWNRQYAHELVSERLVESALSTAASQREAFGLMESLLTTYSENPEVLHPSSGCDTLMARGLHGQNVLINLARSDADGFVMCSALPFKKPLKVNGQLWWREGVKNRRLTVGGPVVGRITHRSVFGAMLPLYRADGSFEGAVSAAIDASWLEKALRERKISAESVVAIVDHDGKSILTAGRNDKLRFDLNNSVGRVARLKLNEDTTLLYASAPLFQKQLYVVYAEPEAFLMSPFRDQARLTLLLPVITVLLTLVAIWVAMNRFVIRWLRRVTRVAGRIGEGQYDNDPAQFDNAPQEIAQLGTTMANMAQAIEERDGALRTSAEQNHAMAREVNHRVKNNLQMVTSLLDLQALRLTDEQAKNVLLQTRMRMGAIALVHRILYDFGEESDYGEVDMDRLMDELCAQLRNAQPGAATLECQSAVGKISADVALPISLFMVEAVTNAYRHGFAGRSAGKIAVSLAGGAESGSLQIVDNGIGSVKAAPVSAIGSQLMEAYASQLNGKYEQSETPGGGVTVRLDYAQR